jgi:hypothetical protein
LIQIVTAANSVNARIETKEARRVVGELHGITFFSPAVLKLSSESASNQ